MRATKNLKLNAFIPITRIFAGVVQIVALFLSVFRFFVFRIYIFSTQTSDSNAQTEEHTQQIIDTQLKNCYEQNKYFHFYEIRKTSDKE